MTLLQLSARIQQLGKRLTQFHSINQTRRLSTITCVLDEVEEALRWKKPVVALESALITHGLAYPNNRNIASNLERIVRDEGAVPATIAVVDGKIRVGLDDVLMQQIAESRESVKVSKRDIPGVLARKIIGGTTISATMAIANSVGIRLLPTGGLGGVHRYVDQTMDISCDLTELARTPLAVISSGVKSILDIRRTLEYLETQGVPVATLSKSKKFPAFFVADSDCDSPCCLADIDQAVSFLRHWMDLDYLKSGVLLAVPVPDSQSANSRLIEEAIRKAVQKAKEKGITGQQVTPFLLKTVSDLTGNKSVEANVALLENNARIGAKISVELCRRAGSDATASIFGVRAQRSTS